MRRKIHEKSSHFFFVLTDDFCGNRADAIGRTPSPDQSEEYLLAQGFEAEINEGQSPDEVEVSDACLPFEMQHAFFRK